ncbi:hypothetical protein D6D01_10250 [Aureobasidium pullulans]|uniref:Uncharacterized protein n=1 Tax=Aureobasidium pullulans TaxID=5580 RepID=A0A4S9JLN1_AURPU|nr:hypothetical protein D6D01_10250 [Aureobasidium pullulans]
MSSRSPQPLDWPEDLWTNIFKAWTGLSPLDLATIFGVYYIIAIIYDPSSCTTTTRSGQVFRCSAWIAPFVRIHNVAKWILKLYLCIPKMLGIVMKDIGLGGFAWISKYGFWIFSALWTLPWVSKLPLLWCTWLVLMLPSGLVAAVLLYSVLNGSESFNPEFIIRSLNRN